MTSARFPTWLCFALAAALLCWLLLVLGIVRVNGGHFTYTLDDPYIHLALAENIARGHYGINLGEASSPSSSIIFPFLLALLLLPHPTEFAPLAVNLVALLATVAALWSFMGKTILREADPNGKLAAFAALLLIVCLNILGVTFTGMEHSPHALLTVLACIGFARTADGGRAPGWLVAVLVLQPLVRFEGLAIFVAGVWFLAGLGHRRQAAIACIALSLCLAAYAAFMAAIGLPFLPSSVMVKSTAPMASLSGGSLDSLRPVLWHMVGVILTPGSSFCGVVLLILLYCLVFKDGFARTPRSMMLQAAVLPIALHLLFGRFGWLHRYEIYINIYAGMMALYLIRDQIREKAAAARAPALALVAVAMLFVFARQGILNLEETPRAANNIHDQQYQMHRFVAEFYPAPVAVNDLGYVSYRNDRYVLDLWGLGSETARRLRRENPPGWIDTLVKQHGVTLAMIYDSWFKDAVPATWRKIATLSSAKQRVSAAQMSVGFYATAPEACAAITARLNAFKPTLPADVSLIINEGACPL